VHKAHEFKIVENYSTDEVETRADLSWLTISGEEHQVQYNAKHGCETTSMACHA
jgi:hypothetical protein